ncbi:hypothetical protein GKC77_02335 [Lactobacillus ruminis]|uniref:Uncharacterized protein n=1 Tax=Ligilactobacillus ruminis TaxID=1623 RepID=A0A6A8GZA2_9LACO|nr:hypothetical protein [Ligilactobacillus ruminis]MSA22137.1 hypothetical protein [Ligilactobacillus ruminis]MSA24048.1 hypothetical protein [Ligilactobacillus ruminis]MSA34255.1 hypothetical protein [Ligilactobacillus ruminis]MSA40686.1 hypothetical protein [Ligilactobacillus ruminis]
MPVISPLSHSGFLTKHSSPQFVRKLTQKSAVCKVLIAAVGAAFFMLGISIEKTRRNGENKFF